MTTVRRTDSGKDARSDTIERTNPHAQTTRKIRKNNLCHRGHSRGQHQSYGVRNNDNAATTYTEQSNQHSGSGHHGEIPPSPASSAVAHSSGTRCGASHNPAETSSARQRGAFRTATQPHQLLRRAHGLLRCLLQSFKALCRRREPAPRAPLPSVRARDPVI